MDAKTSITVKTTNYVTNENAQTTSNWMMVQMSRMYKKKQET